MFAIVQQIITIFICILEINVRHNPDIINELIPAGVSVLLINKTPLKPLLINSLYKTTHLLINDIPGVEEHLHGDCMQ